MSERFTQQDADELAKLLGLSSPKSKKDEDKEDTNDKIYWKYIQGHPNPYGKEFYVYVKKHKNIKFSKDLKLARKEMKELNYKIHTSGPAEKDSPTTLCEKSMGRLFIEFLLDLPDLF